MNLRQFAMRTMKNYIVANAGLMLSLQWPNSRLGTICNICGVMWFLVETKGFTKNVMNKLMETGQ